MAMYDPSTKTYTFPITVEFEDVDSYRIVHNSRIIDYFERARVHFLTEIIGLDLYPPSISLVLYHIDVRFNRPAFLLDALSATVGVHAMDEYRLNCSYRLLRGKTTIARGSSGIAFMDEQQKNLVAAPLNFQTRIAPFIGNSCTIG
jgi:YbgC/YbaW family acyl-CoA thioester hydrolase